MPRKNIDYSRIIIYKFVCNDLNVNDIYVGSTTDFTKRKNCHKARCTCEKSKHYNIKLYQMIRLNGGWYNWSMCEIEKYPCNDANEAKTRERHYCEILNATLNMICPIRTNEEIIESTKQYQTIYTNLNKETKKQYDKEYAELNKDKRKQYQKQYRQNNKDKIKKYHKQYRESRLTSI